MLFGQRITVWTDHKNLTYKNTEHATFTCCSICLLGVYVFLDRGGAYMGNYNHEQQNNKNGEKDNFSLKLYSFYSRHNFPV